MSDFIPPWRKCPRCGKNRYAVGQNAIVCETLGCGRIEKFVMSGTIAADHVPTEITHERGWLRKLREGFQAMEKLDQQD